MNKPTNTLVLSIEGGNIVSRFRGEGNGIVICSYESEQQLQHIIAAHNEVARQDNTGLIVPAELKK